MLTTTTIHRVLSNSSIPHSAAASSGDESDARDHEHERRDRDHDEDHRHHHERDHAAAVGGVRCLREERGVPAGGARSPPRNRSFTNIVIGAEGDAARKHKRRRGDCACPLYRIAIFFGVFSFMAWITYLFLTKDE
ncbi:unnamed protein product [Closterium sp. NIES-53]